MPDKDMSEQFQPSQESAAGDMVFTPVATVKVDERGRFYLPPAARLNLFDSKGIPEGQRYMQIQVGAGAAQGMVLLIVVPPGG